MNVRTLARELSDVFDDNIAGKDRTHYHDLVHLIIGTVKSALMRGEKVSIPGLGVFSVRTRPAIRKSVLANHAATARKIIHLPARTYVHFRPNRALIKELNAH